MNTELVSAIIPVYRDSSTLKESIRVLLSDNHAEKEIIVVVDEPNERLLGDLNEFTNIKVITNKKRVGKVRALNQAIKYSSGNYLLFVDADVILPKNVISDSLIEIENCDILDYTKIGIQSSRISKFTSIDYIQANMISELFSKLSKKTFAIDGAAFMIKREALDKLGGFRPVVSEDFDIATRSHRLGLKYKISVKIRVKVRQPSNFNEWFLQRFRWAYGMGEWLKKNLTYIMGMIIYSPIIAVSAVLIMLPTITMGVLLEAVSSKIVSSYLVTSIYYAIPTTSIPIRAYVLTAYNQEVGRVVMASFSAFLILLPFYYYLSRRYGEKFNPLNFAIYYFVYQPVLLMVFLIGISISFMNLKPDINWVT